MGNCGPNMALTCCDVFSDEILAELGYSDDEVVDLRVAGAVW